jgi:hypothetical protein
MSDHGYVSFVVVIVEPSILCGNGIDKRNKSMIIHYHTEYLVQLWLRLRKHIHDHSLPHRILGSTLITTNGMNQVFCVVMNDHGYVSLVVVIVEPSILCGNEWSWICFVCRSHVWTKQHRILGSNMTRTKETNPWSFITTQNTWFNWLRQRNHVWTKYSVW